MQTKRSISNLESINELNRSTKSIHTNYKMKEYLLKLAKLSQDTNNNTSKTNTSTNFDLYPPLRSKRRLRSSQKSLSGDFDDNSSYGYFSFAFQCPAPEELPIPSFVNKKN